MKIQINGQTKDLEGAGSEGSVLFTLRDKVGLSSPKFGCGLGQCGACTVLLDGEAVPSCTLTNADLGGREVLTLEGLQGDPVAERVKAAWLETAAAQCGYCQAGQMLSAVALLKRNPAPTDAEINEAMDGNLCRCGTYMRIRKAIKLAAGI